MSPAFAGDRTESLPRGLHISFASGQRIAVLTDGVTNFVPSQDEIHRTLRDAEYHVTSAIHLCHRALVGSAGDDVATGVVGIHVASESHD